MLVLLQIAAHRPLECNAEGLITQAAVQDAQWRGFDMHRPRFGRQCGGAVGRKAVDIDDDRRQGIQGGDIGPGWRKKCVFRLAPYFVSTFVAVSRKPKVVTRMHHWFIGRAQCCQGASMRDRHALAREQHDDGDANHPEA
jgi:hypothetical protein